MITGVKAEGDAYQALLLAPAGEKYQIYYGSESAQAPTYDVAALDALLGRPFDSTVANIGPQVKNPTFDASSNRLFKNLLDNPIVLATVIGLMIVVLGLLLYRAGRQIAD